MSTKVSIIIPTHNRADILHCAVDSVRAQTHKDWECLIVDDGSSDHTAELVANLSKQDSRFRYAYQPNAGVAAARNRGLKLALGSWIQFLDSDDQLHPDKLRFQLDHVTAEQQSNTVLYSDFRVVWEDDHGRVTNELVNRFAPMSNAALLQRIVGWQSTPDVPLCPVNTLISRDIFDHHCFDENFAGFEDHAFFVRLLRAGTSFVHTPIVGFSYRRHSCNMTHDAPMMEDSYLQYLEHLAAEDPAILSHCRRMGELIRKAIRNQNQEAFQRLLALVKSSPVPVYFRNSSMGVRSPHLLKLFYLIGWAPHARTRARQYMRQLRSRATP